MDDGIICFDEAGDAYVLDDGCTCTVMEWCECVPTYPVPVELGPTLPPTQSAALPADFRPLTDDEWRCYQQGFCSLPPWHSHSDLISRRRERALRAWRRSAV